MASIMPSRPGEDNRRACICPSARKTSSHMHRPPHAGWPAQAPLVRAVGVVRQARIEPAAHDADIDHVWFLLEAGLAQPIQVAVNTRSRRSRDAGFDASVRLGRQREPWVDLPAIGVEPIDRFSYADAETRANFFYETLARPQLEQILLDAGIGCLRLEVIGTPYHRRPLVGLHQIHSRRASCAVPEDLDGLDGALRFWFAFPRETHTMFFKFCGQP